MKEINGVKLFNVKELSTLLGVSVQTIYKLIRTEKLKGAKIGNILFVSEENLMSFLNGN